MKSARSLWLVATVVSLLPVHAAFAGTKAKSSTITCPAASLGAEIDKLDKTLPDVVEFQGDCVEDIVVDGFSDLTLIGLNGASITATDTTPGSGTTALAIVNSTVNVESITFNGGLDGVECSDRSVCRFRDISIHGGGGGLALQSQSTADLLGSGVIDGYTKNGIGVYGASSLNVQPNWYSGVDYSEYATTISSQGHVGVLVQDGSFFRADNALINDNAWYGVEIQRGAVAKLYGAYAGSGISSNGTGVYIENNSTADIDIPIESNGVGLEIGAVSTAHFYNGSDHIKSLFDANGTPVNCDGVTAISEACTAFLP